MSNTIDVCQTGYDYEQYQLNELENDNMKLREKLDIATKAFEELERKSDKFDDSWSIQDQLDWIKAKCQETLYCLK